MDSDARKCTKIQDVDQLRECVIEERKRLDQSVIGCVFFLHTRSTQTETRHLDEIFNLVWRKKRYVQFRLEKVALTAALIMVALCNRADHYIFAL